MVELSSHSVSLKIMAEAYRGNGLDYVRLLLLRESQSVHIIHSIGADIDIYRAAKKTTISPR